MVIVPNHLVVPVLADPIPDLGCLCPKRLMIGLLVLPILTQAVVLSLLMMTVSRIPVAVAHPREVNCSSLRSLAVIPWLLPRDLWVAGVGFVPKRVVPQKHFEHSSRYLPVAQHSERPIRQPVVGLDFEYSTHQLAAALGFEHSIRQLVGVDQCFACPIR
jgi:hypothetical protein